MTKINKKLCIEIADAIEFRTVPKLAFDMGDWGIPARERSLSTRDQKHECETSGCMAGWNAVLSNHLSVTQLKDADGDVVFKWGREDLGLTEDQADHLFTGQVNATDEECVRHLHQIATTGVVDWNKINPDYYSYAEQYDD